MKYVISLIITAFIFTSTPMAKAEDSIMMDCGERHFHYSENNVKSVKAKKPYMFLFRNGMLAAGPTAFLKPVVLDELVFWPEPDRVNTYAASKKAVISFLDGKTDTLLIVYREINKKEKYPFGSYVCTRVKNK